MFSKSLLVVGIALAGLALAQSGPSAPPNAHALIGSINLTDQTWICAGPVSLDSVTVLIKSVSVDAIHLDAGCTGTIGAISVVQYRLDGIKVHTGAHDLSIGGGSIRCLGHDPLAHQDGIQAMGGTGVTFFSLDDQCLTSNNAALFISEGMNRNGLPTAIVCDSCYLAGGGFPVRIGRSLSSGIRSSQVCPGRLGAILISRAAKDPINLNTTIGCRLSSGFSASPW